MRVYRSIFLIYFIALTHGCFVIGMEEDNTQEHFSLKIDGKVNVVSTLVEGASSSSDASSGLTLAEIDTKLKEKGLEQSFLNQLVEVTKTKDLFAQDEITGRTRLHYAALLQKTKLVKQIIELDQTGEWLITGTTSLLDLRDCKGATALHYVLGAGSDYSKEKIFKLFGSALDLVSAGADVNAQNQYGETPLHYLARYFKYSFDHTPVVDALKELVKFLIKNGANPNTQNENGETALHYGFHNICDNVSTFALDMVPVLLDLGASTTIQNRYGDIPLHYALTYPVPERFILRHFALIIELANRGADPNIQNAWGVTPLYQVLFAKVNKEQVFSLFFDKGGNPNIKNCTEEHKKKGGRTMLQAAVCLEDAELVRLLLEHPQTDPYIKDTPPKGSVTPEEVDGNIVLTPTKGRTALEIAKDLQKIDSTCYCQDGKLDISYYKSPIDEIVELLKWYEHPTIKDLWQLMQERYKDPSKAKSVIFTMIPYLKEITVEAETNSDTESDGEQNNNNNNDIEKKE